jgi:hypothetical protein
MVDELPYRVEDLASVPETVRGLYRESDGGFVLPVTGVKPESEIEGLVSTLEKLKRERKDLKERADRVSDDDVQELERLRGEIRAREEKAAAEAGKLDEIREKWKAETQTEIEKRDQMIHTLAVTSQLQSAISAAGVADAYREDALRALRELSPAVKMVEGNPVGVFKDDVHGDKPIAEFVAEWAKTDAARKYMPPPKGGGGASGQDGKPVDSSKKWADMSPEEKIAYTSAKYGT